MMEFITGLVLGAVAGACALWAWKTRADKAASEKASAKPAGGGGPGEEK